MAKDFLSNAQDAFIQLFKNNGVLKEYNWEDWDSDKEVKMPRGRMNMSADQEIEHSPLYMLKPEIMLEGKPKRQKLSAVMYQLHQLLNRDDLHTLLNAQANGTITFYNAAEKLSIQQTIEGDIRRRTITFLIAAGVSV